MENKKKLIAGIVGGIVGLALIGAVAYLYVNLDNQRRENKAMQELAELDKKEMENEYQQFANQYSEMRMQISNDSIVAQLTAEQEKTERLLKELKETKTSDAREIARLKRELATVRAILRNYVIEIDSLNRLNKNLSEENSRIKGQYNEATRQIEGLNTERASLTEKVAIAAQLDATGIYAAEEQARQIDRQDIEVQDRAGELLYRKERDSCQRHQDFLRAHLYTYGRRARRRRLIQLSEPPSRGYDEEDHRIRWPGESAEPLLECVAVAHGGHIPGEHLCRRQYDWLAQFQFQIIGEHNDSEIFINRLNLLCRHSAGTADAKS